MVCAGAHLAGAYCKPGGQALPWFCVARPPATWFLVGQPEAVAAGESSDRQQPSGQAAAVVASTACTMSWVAASGWDTNETCEAGTSTIVAFARSAMNR
jgi:hypothetical protein